MNNQDKAFIELTREQWKELNKVLKKFQIPFGCYYRDIRKNSADKTGMDKYILINGIVIRDYFDDFKVESKNFDYEEPIGFGEYIDD